MKQKSNIIALSFLQDQLSSPAAIILVFYGKARSVITKLQTDTAYIHFQTIFSFQ